MHRSVMGGSGPPGSDGQPGSDGAPGRAIRTFVVVPPNETDPPSPIEPEDALPGDIWVRRYFDPVTGWGNPLIRDVVGVRDDSEATWTWIGQIDGEPGPPGADGADGADGAVGMVFRGAWDAAASYAVGDVVTRTGSAYRAKIASATVVELFSAGDANVRTFEANDGAWNANEGITTRARDTTHFHSGVASLKVTATANQAATSIYNDSKPAVVSGTAYAFSCWVRPSTTRNMHLTVSGAGGASSTDVSCPAGVWTQLSYTFTALSTTTVYPYPVMVSATSGDYFNLDDLTFYGLPAVIDLAYWDVLAAVGGTGATGATGAAGSPAQADTQILTADGTYTVPAGKTAVQIICVGNGGPGGSGRRGAAGTVRCGGGGGGAGGVTNLIYPVSTLPATLIVAGISQQPGAAAQAVDDTNGITASTGIEVTVVAPGGSVKYAGASYGGAGVGGTAAAGTAGFAGSGVVNGSPGAAASTVGGVGAAAQGTSWLASPGGGGAGGGITAADVTGRGGQGGYAYVSRDLTHGSVAFGNADTGSPGGTPVPDGWIGMGGGGGGASSAMTAGAGGDGAKGGGGGGGGASLNGQPSGAGGKGGAGHVIFIAY